MKCCNHKKQMGESINNSCVCRLVDGFSTENLFAGVRENLPRSSHHGKDAMYLWGDTEGLLWNFMFD